MVVNAVAPGLILPPEGEDADYLERLAHTNPMNCWGHSQDLADAVRFPTDLATARSFLIV